MNILRRNMETKRPRKEETFERDFKRAKEVNTSTPDTQILIEKRCPYLSTVNRHLLDFDFEKLCSVSLSRLRVYGCLVCGKFFQGKGPTTYAYTHSLEQEHHLFIDLENGRVWCLPDGYEVTDHSLDDIRNHLHPKFTPEEVRAIGRESKFCKSLDGGDFIPGFIGLNNLNKTDCYNVVIQMLIRVPPLRNLLLLLNLRNKQSPDPILLTFSDLVKKIFNPRNFKGLVLPHEFLQATGVESNKEFKVGTSADPVAFFAWLVHRLHLRLRSKAGESIVHGCFQGKMCVTRWKVSGNGEEIEENEKSVPFCLLSLSLPSAPIFKEDTSRPALQQASIFELMTKFDGQAATETAPGKLSRYRIKELPPFLVVQIARFTQNQFTLEKNLTQVTFPLKNLDLSYLTPNSRNCAQYDLLANIVHEGPASGGSWAIYVKDTSCDKWRRLQDLGIEDALAEVVERSESYLQLYCRRDFVE